MYNDSAIFITGSCALSQSAYVSWGSATGSGTSVGFFQNNNGTLMFKDHTSGSWTELGNTRDNTQLGDAAADIVTANGQLTASQGISATLNSKFDENVILGSAADDIITVNGQLTASQGISATLNSKFDANVTLGNAAADVITATGQLTASQGISAALNSKFDENVILGSAADDIITVNGQLTASQGALFNNDVRVTDGNKLYFGTTGTGHITGSGNGLVVNADFVDVSGSLHVSGTLSAYKFETITHNSTTYQGSNIFGNDALDVTTVTSQLTASQGVLIADDKKLYFGDLPDASIEYDEDDTNRLSISGSAAGAQILGDLHISGHLTPTSDNAKDLGSSSNRWANVYTADLHLKNDRGDWTIVEEEDYLCVVNNKTNKRYKMMLEEIQD